MAEVLLLIVLILLTLLLVSHWHSSIWTLYIATILSLGAMGAGLVGLTRLLADRDCAVWMWLAAASFVLAIIGMIRADQCEDHERLHQAGG